MSGSADIRFAKPESQKPWQPPPKSRDEFDEEKRIQTELLPFVLGFGSQISEAEREKRHEALLGMVAEKERSIKALKDLNRNLDPFSEAHRVNDALRWEEERRHTGMQRVVKDLERYIAKEYPGTTLSDKLYQRHHKDRLTRKQQERVDERAATIAEFQKHLRESGQAPNMLETFLAQTAGNVKHTAAGAWELMGGDATELRESADDNQVFASTREGLSGAIMRGAGDVVGTIAGSPSGKVGWVVSTVRGLANGYSQTLAETGDREEAKRALIAEAPWLAVYAVAGKIGAKGGKLLLPKNPGPLLKSAAAFGGEAVSSISVGTVRSIVEGKEYGLQQLTADTLIAYFQARGSYKSETSAAGREAAKQELSRRGFSEEQIVTPFDAGESTPAEIISPKVGPSESQSQVLGNSSTQMRLSEEAKSTQNSERQLPSNSGTNKAANSGSKAKQNSQNTTRMGVKRNNRKDWKDTRDLWDMLGYGEILSSANRALIAKGRVPVVDDHWIAIFPEDQPLKGEIISVHHVKGLSITTVLPYSRHMDAHLPGGTSRNFGNIGSQGPLGRR